MTTRDVFGTARRTDGTLWPNHRVSFIRGASYTVADAYPADRYDVDTNAVGYFLIPLWCNTEGIVGTQYTCVMEGDQFVFTLLPGDPIDWNQLRGMPPGGVGIDNLALLIWASGENYELTAITYNVTYLRLISTATVKWPDGSAGVFTTLTGNATFQAPDAYTITHALSGKTVTQPLVTRNAQGDVTVKPAMTIT